ncbi:toll/interleukin-1 receptor domain-containing protein [Streptomyces sp. Act143]|uniref:toll/interleukin-1 receptor domain-containing protein n=1 Tax=Streptomyces sp. Act143 TaxID=2200760 RepID=UPI0015E809BF|nr:toll/interleukin-1 receptor domain-containing protein [Streptomyces sp. Act143]
MTNVFVSHSFGGDPLAEEITLRVFEGLRTATRNYDVKLDKARLRPGREWYPQLMQWIAECDVAVVFLNAAALESTWVRREVNVLMWRRSLCPSLRVLPVLIGEVTAEQVEKSGFEELLPVQYERVPYDPADGSYADRLVEEVLRQFAELPDVRHETDHMRCWIEDVARLLNTVHDTKALMDTGRALGIREEDLPQTAAFAGGGEFLAHHMLAAATPEEVRDAVHEVARSMGGSSLADLIALLTPVWVDAVAARRVLPPEGLVAKRLVALHARETKTAGQYVDRAMCRRIRFYRYEMAGGLPAGEDLLDDAVEQCVEAVRRLLYLPPRKQARDFRPRKDYLHCLILDIYRIRPRLVHRIVTRVHELFPWLLIVLVADESDPAHLRLSPPLADLVILPALTEEDEDLGYQFTHELRDLPRQRNGQEVSA